MFELGPHSFFIWASYTVAVLVISGLTIWVLCDGRKQRKLLAELEAQGVSRRSSRNKPSDQSQP